MIKISERNRGVVILAGIILTGLILIGILMLVENDDLDRVIVSKDAAPSNNKSLELKIDNLSRQSFNPAWYSTIATEIESSYNQNLITGDVKRYLENKLKATYANLLYNQCNLFLKSNSSYSSNNILSWLKNLENISGRNMQIDFYRTQIKMYEYYSKQLPRKINQFLQGDIQEFDEPTCLRFKQEITTMQGFDEKFKNTTRFIQIKNDLISKLDDLNNRYAQEQINSNTNQ